MGNIEFVPFPGSVGTAGLGGCSVVIIVSHYAAILAHIQPNVPGSTKLTSGQHFVKQKMDLISDLYRQQKHFFPTGTETVVVCAILEGAIATPDLQQIIEARIEGLGLSPHLVKTYEINPKVELNEDSSKGTVFVDRRGQRLLIYVEDNLVHSSHSPAPSTQLSGSGQTQKGGETGEWVRDPQYKLHRRLVRGQWEWESEDPGWIWDSRYEKYRRFVNNKWEWAQV